MTNEMCSDIMFAALFIGVTFIICFTIITYTILEIRQDRWKIKHGLIPRKDKQE